MMMADTMDALGLAGKYVVKVNSRKVLNGVLEAIGLDGDDNAERRLVVLRAIDKLDRLGGEGVAALLGKGRRDESGAFTEGAGLSAPQTDNVMRLLGYSATVMADSTSIYNADELAHLSYPTNASALDWLDQRVELGPTGRQGSAELRAMAEIFERAGYPRSRIRIDPSVVRGLEYYTGPVFEIELTFPVTNEKGEQVVFGSVGGGGRYDGLVSRFRSEPVPATGFSIGVSRLATALRLTGNLPAAEPVGPVVVLVMDRDQTARYQEMVSRLRKAGIRAEMFLGATKNFGKQLAYADRRNSPAVVIEGSDERARGVLQIKDLVAGKEAAAKITDNAEWKAERPGQFECPNEELVDRILALPAVKAALGQR
jgi:histidyl-tRNA synthetase